MDRSHKRQIRNYLLNRKYQLRYTLIMVVISALLTSGLGYIWYQQMREASEAVEVKAITMMDDAEVTALRQEITSQDNLRLLVLVGFGILVALVLTGYGIILTHKVAGPLYKIGLHMSAVAEGKLGPIGNIRKGDHLHEFYSTFQKMHDALREGAQQDVGALNAAVAALERHLDQPDGEGDEIQQALGGIKKLAQEKEIALER
jgi:nitrogen fixation/metabolism regulation signal transduction histidine kinase